jgi:hypothetical protein
VLQTKIKFARGNAFRGTIATIFFSNQETQAFNQLSTLQSMELVSTKSATPILLFEEQIAR